MHRVGAEQTVEILRQGLLGGQVPLGDEGAESMGGVFGGQEAQHGPVRVGKCGFDRVKAEDGETVGLRLSPRRPLRPARARREGLGMVRFLTRHDWFGPYAEWGGRGAGGTIKPRNPSPLVLIYSGQGPNGYP